jgi:Zn-dependent protease with chaperone function
MKNTKNTTLTSSTSQIKKSNYSKFFIMSFFIIIDIGLNSSLDYDNYAENNILLIGLFGAQVIVQITIFLVLFLATADTFLFQVGLLGILVRKVSITLMLQFLYFIVTIINGALRNRRYRDGYTTVELLDDDGFFAISTIQKLGENILFICFLC